MARAKTPPPGTPTEPPPPPPPPDSDDATADADAPAPIAVGSTEITHLRGCPGGREEEYETRTPEGTVVTVKRCVECGANAVRLGPITSTQEV